MFCFAAMSLLSVLGTSHPSIQREEMDPSVRIDLGRWVAWKPWKERLEN